MTRGAPRRRLALALLPLLLSALLLALAAPRASGHALLTKSTPAANSVLASPPAEAVLTFIEPIEPQYSEVKLFDADGHPVSTPPSRLGDATTLVLPLPANLPDGTYTLQWKNISKVDGHLVTGYIPFTIGKTASLPSPAAAPAVTIGSGGSAGWLDTLGRWLGILGAVALSGALLNWLLVLRPAVAGLPELAIGAVGARVRLLALAGAAVALVGSVLLLAAEAGHAAGTISPGSLVDFAHGTRFGWFWLARVALVLLTAVLASRPAAWSNRGRRWRWLAVVLAGGLFLPYALVSHAAAQAAGSPAAVSADWLHLLGTAVWIGGLLALLAGLIHNSALPAESRRPVYAAAIQRFSTVAMAAVVVLVLTGLYAAWLEVGSWAALRDTRYGHALDVKLLLLIPLLGLASYNLVVVGPAMLRVPSAAVSFTRTVLGEATFGVAILLVVGVLMGLPTGRQVTSQPSDHPLMRFGHDGIAAVVQLTPGTVGLNRYTVDVTRNGRPLPESYQVLLDVSSSQLNGLREIALTRSAGDGDRWEAQGSELSVAGQWQVRLIVRPPDIDDWGALRTLEIGRTYTPAPPQPVSRFEGYTPALLMLISAAGMALLVVGLRFRGPRETRRLVLEAGAGLLVIGAVTLALTLGAGESAAAASFNPVQPTSDSISRGHAAYQQQCARCHGADLRGDGPDAAGLTSPPADLTQHVGAHPDGQLFDWISNGIPNTAMPPFTQQLAATQIWDLINYLRSATRS
ncbi:MAG TPA: copper resistance protein CopC [Thermomicrobiaceae bacterium]|nr:copper resistance protein CopC [Thermomicrobiaceae bacterium]